MTTALISREYNGNVFHFREDGYFNMTKAAKAFGRWSAFGKQSTPSLMSTS
ncbi:MAG: hypothetical protein KKC02_03615 [Gammaproteobacteria bacterium]|nr:hypothetical protein [Gammaproteobacteria bacterium]